MRCRQLHQGFIGCSYFFSYDFSVSVLWPVCLELYMKNFFLDCGQDLLSHTLQMLPRYFVRHRVSFALQFPIFVLADLSSSLYSFWVCHHA